MISAKRLALALCASASGLVMAGKASAQDANRANNVGELVVTAPRQEEIARERQFNAPNLVNIQAAETIQKYPDFNAAEALGRIPGVSISTDTGEGRFVNIRGIDGNLVGATFGGVPLLNTNTGGTYFGGGGRAVEFDTIPTGAIDGLVVTKTTLPDHEAEGLGGTVELSPRTATNVMRPFFEGTAGWGYEPAHGHAGPLNLEGATGGRFGFSDGHLVQPGDSAPAGGRFVSNPTPFSLVLTGSWRSDRRGFDDIEEDYNDPTVDRSYADIQMRRYDYHRRRYGYGGEFDFRPNDQHLWYLRANIAGYVESVKKNRLTFDGLDNTANPANPKGFSTTTDITLASTDEQEAHRNQIFVFGGRDEFGKGVVLDYRASYSSATFRVDKNFGAKFTGPSGLPFTYDNSGNNGDFPAITVNTALVNDPAQYKPIKKVSNSTEDDRDQETAYAANLLVPLDVFGDDKLKVGGEARIRHKDVNPYSYSYAISSLSLASASGPATTDFYGRYTNGPNVDLSSVRAAALAGTLSGGLDPSGVIKAKEDIYAGYAQYQATIGAWGLLAGVRIERTEAAYGAFSDDNPTQTLAFTSRPVSYTNAFPTVQVRYQVQPNFLVRATYSTGIARPGFLQNTASTSSNHDPTDPQISQGNPNLKPTTGNNFDLAFEFYLPHGGVLQVGLFDKEFDNYIVRQNQKRRYDGVDPEFDGLIVNYSTFANRSGAYARGIEAAVHDKFDFLPGLWSGLGVDGNITLVSSHILEYDAATSATGHDESGLLPGTSRLTWNLAGFYEKGPAQVRLSAEYVSKELFSLGGSKAADSIQDNRLTMDLTASYQIQSYWTVYFNAKNLLNTPLRFYVNDPSSPMQREYYDLTYEAGVRFKF